ncbi:MAG: DUF2442 domain-containing protein [Oscillospiraceae bacterium]|nr:DUF2442 domain-containing protein [Oscillospiraceae bacterium]
MYPKVKSVQPIDNYRIIVEWVTSERRIFDVKPYLIGSWYSQLLDVTKFNTVHPCGSTVEWFGGQDIAPHELYELSSAE